MDPDGIQMGRIVLVRAVNMPDQPLLQEIHNRQPVFESSRIIVFLEVSDAGNKPLMFAPMLGQRRIVCLLHQGFFRFEVVLGIVRQFSQHHPHGGTLPALAG